MISNNLLSYFGSAKKVYLADRSAYIEAGVCNNILLDALLDKSLKKADEEISNANKQGIQLVAYGEENYPSILYEIPDSPLILYIKGDLDILLKRNMFCVVGTRHSTVYGMSATLAVSEQLARCGLIIVSGVAFGIDSAAHKGAIKGGGKTIGIMGCGLDVAYPRGNDDTRKLIIENGALISEFPLGTPPLGGNFPRRNRLLSAFSLGVAVMEAGEKSGALITAKLALEQGRDVFALPGNISNPKSSGTNQLISDGAILLTGADVILAEYIMRYPHFFPVQEILEEWEFEETKKQEMKIICGDLASPSPSEKERRIKEVLSKEPLHVDEIARISGLKIQDVLSTITIMQINKRIKEFPGNRFSL